MCVLQTGCARARVVLVICALGERLKHERRLEYFKAADRDRARYISYRKAVFAVFFLRAHRRTQ